MILVLPFHIRCWLFSLPNSHQIHILLVCFGVMVLCQLSPRYIFSFYFSPQDFSLETLPRRALPRLAVPSLALPCPAPPSHAMPRLALPLKHQRLLQSSPSPPACDSSWGGCSAFSITSGGTSTRGTSWASPLGTWATVS